MKVEYYSVRLKSLTPISDKAYKAEGFDGTSAILPKSQVFGKDNEVSKSDAYWISAWILEKKKELTYSKKKRAWFDSVTGKMNNIEVTHHVPMRKTPINNTIESLKK